MYLALVSFGKSTSCLTSCRIFRRRRAVSRKELNILCSTEGIPTLCICSRYTTTSLYNSTSRWKIRDSSWAHQFPDPKAHRAREHKEKKMTYLSCNRGHLTEHLERCVLQADDGLGKWDDDGHIIVPVAEERAFRKSEVES